ncbi:MAG: HD domain-containing protein [Clostridiales bacterium]|nr:HD domain-containing protein [Clostridiales bacterium]
MQREKRVIEFYVLCNKLKDLVRTGWQNWNVNRHRVESVAEHIYGVQMLAIAMWAEFKYDLDIKKTLTMIAVHEMEETIIGDITCFQKTKEEKVKLGHQAVVDIFKKLCNADEIRELIFEFEKRQTLESQFAYFCDKLECDIQAKLYDEQGCVDLNMQEQNETAKNEDVKKLLTTGMSWAEMWLTYGQERYNYDENFLAVSDYVKNNKIIK